MNDLKTIDLVMLIVGVLLVTHGLFSFVFQLFKIKIMNLLGFANWIEFKKPSTKIKTITNLNSVIFVEQIDNSALENFKLFLYERIKKEKIDLVNFILNKEKIKEDLLSEKFKKSVEEYIYSLGFFQKIILKHSINKFEKIYLNLYKDQQKEQFYFETISFIDKIKLYLKEE